MFNDVVLTSPPTPFQMKTEFRFFSTAFNITDPQDYFINECCFGDDVARWLAARLQEQGLQTTEPGQEDFGWYFTFSIGEAEHCVVIGFQPNDLTVGDQWLGSVERQKGLFGSLFGGRQRDILPEAIEAIDTALRSS